MIEVVASGVPAGLGEPVYDKLDADLAKAMMSINAVKGVEIGAGFGAAALSGEDNADEIRIGNDGRPLFLSNHAGGILGGISTGQDVVVRFAVKPTSSILTPRRTIDRFGNEIEIVTKGRHDPCVGIRAVPVGEAMLAFVLADHLLRQRALGHDASVRSGAARTSRRHRHKERSLDHRLQERPDPVEDEIVAAAGNDLGAAARDRGREVAAHGDRHHAIGLAVPKAHRDPDLLEAKGPGPGQQQQLVRRALPAAGGMPRAGLDQRRRRPRADPEPAGPPAAPARAPARTALGEPARCRPAPRHDAAHQPGRPEDQIEHGAPGRRRPLARPGPSGGATPLMIPARVMRPGSPQAQAAA